MKPECNILTNDMNKKQIILLQIKSTILSITKILVYALYELHAEMRWGRKPLNQENIWQISGITALSW